MVARIQGEVARQCRKNPLAFQEETTLNTVPEDVYEYEVYEENAVEAQPAAAPVELEGGLGASGFTGVLSVDRDCSDLPYMRR